MRLCLPMRDKGAKASAVPLSLPHQMRPLDLSCNGNTRRSLLGRAPVGSAAHRGFSPGPPAVLPPSGRLSKRSGAGYSACSTPTLRPQQSYVIELSYLIRPREICQLFSLNDLIPIPGRTILSLPGMSLSPRRYPLRRLIQRLAGFHFRHFPARETRKQGRKSRHLKCVKCVHQEPPGPPVVLSRQTAPAGAGGRPWPPPPGPSPPHWHRSWPAPG